MRCAFAGSGDFALPALEALVQAGRPPVLVLTRPDRPAGRGLKARETQVGARAAQAGLAVLRPASLRETSIHEVLQQARLDMLITAAYGLLLPASVLQLPRLGCINLHASLLPRWRGAAPIVRALLAGDACTGVSIFQMEEGLDTGPLLAQGQTPITGQETAGSLEDKLAHLAASLLLDVLGQLEAGTATFSPQSSEGACYATKLTTAEAVIHWQQDARTIERLVRAMSPRPHARFFLGERMVLVHEASLMPCSGPQEAGAILEVDATSVTVACGAEALRLHVLQPAGGRPMSAAAFWRGLRVQPERLAARHACGQAS